MKILVVGCETHFFFMEKEIELQNLINEYFTSSDYKIIENVIRGEKGTRVLEIFIDNEKGINIDEITKINKDLSSLIDEKIDMFNISNLVVSSPGAERPLKFYWQLKKHAGRVLEIEMNDGEKIEGKLEEFPESSDVKEGEEKITVEITVKEKGKKNTVYPREIKFKDIKEVKVKLRFTK